MQSVALADVGEKESRGQMLNSECISRLLSAQEECSCNVQHRRNVYMQCSAKRKFSTGDSQAKSANNAIIGRSERAKRSDGQTELIPTVKPRKKQISSISRVKNENKAL